MKQSNLKRKFVFGKGAGIHRISLNFLNLSRFLALYNPETLAQTSHEF
jgi:hypothetical protein